MVTLHMSVISIIYIIWKKKYEKFHPAFETDIEYFAMLGIKVCWLPINLWNIATKSFDRIWGFITDLLSHKKILHNLFIEGILITF